MQSPNKRRCIILVLTTTAAWSCADNGELLNPSTKRVSNWKEKPVVKQSNSNHSVCTTTRVNTYHHETILKLGKSSPAINQSITTRTTSRSTYNQIPSTPQRNRPPRFKYNKTRREHIPTIVQSCPSRILNQEISSSSSIITLQ